MDAGASVSIPRQQARTDQHDAGKRRVCCGNVGFCLVLVFFLFVLLLFLWVYGVGVVVFFFVFFVFVFLLLLFVCCCFCLFVVCCLFGVFGGFFWRGGEVCVRVYCCCLSF